MFNFRDDIKIEPLVNHWYAWPCLIYPATFALFTQKHLRIMKSFLKAPEIHLKSANSKQLRGGSFIHNINQDLDLPKKIATHLHYTENELTPYHMLSSALHTLMDILNNEARGESLQPLYQQIPDLLKPYTEIIYDLNHHANFRIFEQILYKSAFNTSNLQQVTLQTIQSDNRAFVLSTPLFPSLETINIRLPFKHIFYDQLFKLRQYTINDETTIKKLYSEIDDGQNSYEKFRKLFSPTSLHKKTDSYSRGLTIKYFGHACVLLESPQCNILIDPFISYSYPGQTPRFTFNDLPENIDYVLITHGHLDHLVIETLLQIRYKVKHIVVPQSNYGSLQDPSLKLILHELGFASVIVLHELDEITLDHGCIMGLPFLGEHGDLDVRSKLAYHLRISDHSLIFAADSNNLQPEIYQKLYPLLKKVDYLFIGMECDGAPMSWLYGTLPIKLPRNFDQTRRLDGSDCEKAYKMITTLQCKNVYIYAMGAEPWVNYVSSIQYDDDSKPIIESNNLLEICNKQGIKAERLKEYKLIELPG